MLYSLIARRNHVLLGRRPLAVTVPTGTVIFVTPRAAGWADIGVLRHELSHAVQNQNRSFVRVPRMLRQPWVSEGVAGVVEPGRHLLSLPEGEFLARVKTEDLWPSFSTASPKDFRFSYTAWIEFWNRRIETGGKPALLDFERACFSDPPGCTAALAAVYGKDLRRAVEDMQTSLRSDRTQASAASGGQTKDGRKSGAGGGD